MQKLGDHKQKVSSLPQVTFTIRLDQAALDSIRVIAELHGVGPTQLVRTWVLDRLALEREAGPLSELTTDYPADVERLIRTKVIDAIMRTAIKVAEKATEDVF